MLNWGYCGEKILEYAHVKKVDMIVMGSSNRLKGISKIKALGKCYSKGFRIVTLSPNYNSLNGSSVFFKFYPFEIQNSLDNKNIILFKL